ncbi:MAG TPA: hypothetical protein VNT79_06265 [Phycisphaerae bacterium]|nr:hypothetical protein [Phycisphaerae bacterium]
MNAEATPKEIDAETEARHREFELRYGVCPICKRCSGPISVNKYDWLYCAKHRVKWCISWNLWDFSEGRPRKCRKNQRFLSRFTTIEPLHLEEPAAAKGAERDEN